MPRKIVVVGC